MNITLERLPYSATRIGVAHIGVDDNLQQLLQIVGTATALPVKLAETAQVKALHYTANKTDRVVFRNVLVDSLKEKHHLIW